MGRLFERYIFTELAQAHDQDGARVLESRIHGDTAYRIKKQEYRSADIVVNYGDRLVMIEVTLMRPRLEQTQIRGLQEAFETDVEHIVVDNARQLDRNLRAMMDGRYVLRGIDPKLVRRIFPVIVTLGHMPEGDLTWEVYEQALKRRHLLQSTILRKDVARLQLLTAEDIEILRDLIHEGTALADLLERKSVEPFLNIPFKNFLLSVMPERLSTRGAGRRQELERVIDRVTELVLGERRSQLKPK